MKYKIYYLIILHISTLLFLNVPCFAQGSDNNKKYVFEGGGLVGWMLAGKTSTAKIINAPVYSLSAAYVRTPQVAYELSFNTLYSNVHYASYNGQSDTVTHYSQTYIMFGIVRHFQTEIPKFTPYMSSTIGFMSQSVQVANVASQTQLAAGLLGGFKYFIKDNLGIKIQARVQAPLSGIGLGVGFGIGGPRVGIGSYSNNIQFDFSGGIFFRL